MSVDIEQVDFLAPVSFLMEIGTVVIAIEVNNGDYIQFFQEKIKKLEMAKESDIVYTNMTFTQVTAKLFEDLYFDKSFILVMQYMDDISHSPEDIKMYINTINVVRKAVNMNQ